MTTLCRNLMIHSAGCIGLLLDSGSVLGEFRIYLCSVVPMDHIESALTLVPASSP